ncbi:sulfur carrier protein ThiS adenylyltransferase ThiF [Thiospirochaeta perfilievii]|uniref:Sulfur carrier protein ThiS adenylyltransferase ThiF n=1 Tax=Thiospirochaeta perfilievii TaxID=252967 RepID=A0A5C1QCM5_9SPIO|nr:sulfur carrier protein ThiS adenylyltransferase ThiF [Thiospirochaeta perfilievii]QEN05865.1 sulfur carrier protein ThiS adenylyltransferase ThiF [Thiospirochaeta perfilievii]
MTSLYTKQELLSIEKKIVGIAGCGGLGSNTALNLVRMGFKHFILVDFDRIDISNLNRQFYFYKQIGDYKVEALKENLLMINPNITVDIVRERLDKNSIFKIFSSCNFIVEGLDTIESKKTLLENIPTNVRCVSASGLGNFWKTDGIVERELNSRLTVVGDFKSGIEDGISPIMPGVSICSAKQAALILKYSIKDLRCTD